MKNFVIILMILIGSCNFAYATQNKALKIKLANTIYELKYSNCTEQSAICMNEYYKKGEIGFLIPKNNLLQQVKVTLPNLKNLQNQALALLR